MSNRLDSLQRNQNAGANHDIKTLVNGVLCMSSLLEGTPLSIEQAEIVQLLRKSAEELGLIMTNVLDQSQPDLSKIITKKRAFNLSETLETTLNTFRLTIQDKPIEVLLIMEGKVPATVKGDKLALQRILSNLLHNAGKFTQAGKIELYVTAEKEANNKSTLTFQIKDTGIGIEKFNLSKIFNQFTKFNSDGYGLGLATAKELVELNDGLILVESAVGKGTTFTFSLPYEITHFKAAQKITPLSISALKNKHILIADDDEVYVKYLTTILSQCKAHLTVVKDGKAAFEMSHAHRFDVIMLDLYLPELDGYETAFQIRNTLNINKHTTIIGMSAAEADPERVIISDMNDVFPKPLNSEALVNRLQKALMLDRETFAFNKKSKNENFKFSHELDTAHLKKLYGNDIEHAVMMFETFLEESLHEWYNIIKLEKKGDLLSIKEKSHRLKTAFSMVGLTNIEGLLADLEKNIMQYSALDINKILMKMDVIIKHAKPVLLNELKRLKYVYSPLAA